MLITTKETTIINHQPKNKKIEVLDKSELDALCKRVDRALNKIGNSNVLILTNSVDDIRRPVYIVGYRAPGISRILSTDKLAGTSRLVSDVYKGPALPLHSFNFPQIQWVVRLGRDENNLTVLGNYISHSLELSSGDYRALLPLDLVEGKYSNELPGIILHAVVSHGITRPYWHSRLAVDWTSASSCLFRAAENPNALFQLLMNSNNSPLRIKELLSSNLAISSSIQLPIDLTCADAGIEIN